MTDQTSFESARYPDGHPAIRSGRVGILLINVGTPEATSYWAVRPYLKEFLSDPRVVDTKGPLWWFILNAIILTRKPGNSARAYAKVWNHERNESPLKTITRNQAERLDTSLANERLEVAWAMRYGQPAIAPMLDQLRKRGCERIFLFPLYPQYCSATTATALDEAFKALQTMRWQPAIRTMPAYYDHPHYISAVAESVRAQLATLSFEPEIILASFHGLPIDFLAKGDPYYCHCQSTARLLRQALGYSSDKMVVTFQSQTSRKEWHKPFTDQTIIELAQQGVKNLLVITPGFAADCVETQEEIAIRGRDSFQRHGGMNFSLTPCLNDSDASLGMLTTLVFEQLQGWL